MHLNNTLEPPMQTYSLTQECVDSYRVNEQPAGGVEITITVPKRFADLWLVKLSELRTTAEEIATYEGTDRHLHLS